MYALGGVTDVQSDKLTDSLCVDDVLHECDQECTVMDVSVDKLWSTRRL